jgi:hypothetical protein
VSRWGDVGWSSLHRQISKLSDAIALAEQKAALFCFGACGGMAMQTTAMLALVVDNAVALLSRAESHLKGVGARFASDVDGGRLPHVWRRGISGVSHWRSSLADAWAGRGCSLPARFFYIISRAWSKDVLSAFIPIYSDNACPKK